MGARFFDHRRSCQLNFPEPKNPWHRGVCWHFCPTPITSRRSQELSGHLDSLEMITMGILHARDEGGGEGHHQAADVPKTTPTLFFGMRSPPINRGWVCYSFKPPILSFSQLGHFQFVFFLSRVGWMVPFHDGGGERWLASSMHTSIHEDSAFHSCPSPVIQKIHLIWWAVQSPFK